MSPPDVTVLRHRSDLARFDRPAPGGFGLSRALGPAGIEVPRRRPTVQTGRRREEIRHLGKGTHIDHVFSISGSCPTRFA